MGPIQRVVELWSHSRHWLGSVAFDDFNTGRLVTSHNLAVHLTSFYSRGEGGWWWGLWDWLCFSEGIQLEHNIHSGEGYLTDHSVFLINVDRSTSKIMQYDDFCQHRNRSSPHGRGVNPTGLCDISIPSGTTNVHLQSALRIPNSKFSSALKRPVNGGNQGHDHQPIDLWPMWQWMYQPFLLL